MDEVEVDKHNVIFNY